MKTRKKLFPTPGKYEVLSGFKEVLGQLLLCSVQFLI